jgi:hypothetical protein
VLLRLRARFAAFLVGICLLLVAPLGHAQDSTVRDQLQQIMQEDYASGGFQPAKRKLQELLSTCMKKGCGAGVKAEVYVALGMVASQLAQPDEAKQSFKNAQTTDPNAKLPANATPNQKKEWDEAKGGGDKPAAAAGGEGDEPPPQGLAATVKLITEALKADQEGRLEECIDKDKQALKIDENPRTRLHLASCEARSQRLVEALKDAKEALAVAIQKKDTPVMRIARTRVNELIERIPHVTFVPPSGEGVKDLKVTFDDRPVPADSYSKKFSIDPGKHKVVATGTVNGFEATYDEEIEVRERELSTVRITLTPANAFITPGQIACMKAAKNQEEVQKCLPQNRKSLVVRIATDLSGYSDTNSVAVYTPAANVSLVSPTAGWNFGGNFLVDAVSAASPDIVSSASPPFKEYRYAGGVTGGYKPGLFGAQASLSASDSPDYTSYTAGGRLTADLNDKLVTPTAGYSYSYDRIGRGILPSGKRNYLNDFLPLKGFLHTHEIEAGVTFVMSPTSLLLIGGTLSLERGDGSQPYRYIPMFDPDNVAPFVPKGATVDLVNRTRLPVRPLEQLPTERERYAVGARFNKRLNNATLRFEQRFYVDTWGLKATSTDTRYMVDLSRHLRVWPHLRIHGQTGTNFYQLAYSAILDPNGQIILPTYRTGDRELSPLLTATAGGGVRLALGEPEGEVKYGITIVGDVMYTRYLKALYVTTRTAVYGAIGFDVEF